MAAMVRAPSESGSTAVSKLNWLTSNVPEIPPAEPCSLVSSVVPMVSTSLP